jgi:nitrite reductase/ring-hydroxylating ferredoxin subunit
MAWNPLRPQHSSSSPCRNLAVLGRLSVDPHFQEGRPPPQCRCPRRRRGNYRTDDRAPAGPCRSICRRRSQDWAGVGYERPLPSTRANARVQGSRNLIYPSMVRASHRDAGRSSIYWKGQRPPICGDSVLRQRPDIWNRVGHHHFGRDRKNPWGELFDSDRSAIRHGVWDHTKENADYPYYLIRDRFAGTQGRSLRPERPGQGRIIEYQGTTVAAYRDPRGKLTLRSATCTHMGCRVAWNEGARTWDCPCHGSRFTLEGDVFSGPAEAPLSPQT